VKEVKFYRVGVPGVFGKIKIAIPCCRLVAPGKVK